MVGPLPPPPPPPLFFEKNSPFKIPGSAPDWNSACSWWPAIPSRSASCMHRYWCQWVCYYPDDHPCHIQLPFVWKSASHLLARLGLVGQWWLFWEEIKIQGLKWSPFIAKLYTRSARTIFSNQGTLIIPAYCFFVSHPALFTIANNLIYLD